MPVLNAADKIYLLSQQIDRAYLGGELVFGSEPQPLDAWVNALGNVANQQARVMWIGDSILEGTGASSRDKRALDLILAQLVQDYPVAGQGQSQYLPAVYACPTSGQTANTTWGGLWATSTSGTVTQRLDNSAFGLGMRSIELASSGATAVYTLQGTAADVWFAAGGSFQYAVDGGAYSASISTASMDANGDVYPISLGASGSHTLAVRQVSGTVRLLGFTQFDGSRDKGIALFDACHWGAKAPDFYDAATPGAPQNAKFTRVLQVAAPHLVVLNSGLNEDYALPLATLIAHYQGLADAVKAARPSASVLVCRTPDQGPDNQPPTGGDGSYTRADYKAAIVQMAADNGWPMLKMWDQMPPTYIPPEPGINYFPDGQHLTDAGAALFESVAINVIDPVRAAPRIELTAPLPPTVVVGVEVSFSVTATLVNGAAGPVVITAPSLPAGLTISATTGTGPYTATISGTPTTEAVAADFTISASNGAQSASANWNVTVNAASSSSPEMVATANFDANFASGTKTLAVSTGLNVQKGDVLVLLLGTGANDSGTLTGVSDPQGNSYSGPIAYTGGNVWSAAFYAVANADITGWTPTLTSPTNAPGLDLQVYVLRGVSTLNTQVGYNSTYQSGTLNLPSLAYAPGIILTSACNGYSDINTSVQSPTDYTIDSVSSSGANNRGMSCFAHKIVTASGTDNIVYSNTDGNERLGGIALNFT